MDLTGRRLAALAATAAATLGAGATIAPSAQADNGKAQLAVNQLSNGAYAGVTPSAVMGGITHNPGAGAPFGVDAPGKFSTNTMTFSPPANTTISGYAAQVYNMFAYGWPAMGTYTALHTSWGDFNVGGNPGTVDQAGTFTGGATGSISAGVEQWSGGSGADQPGRVYLSRLAVELSDANAPVIDQAPATGKLFGDPGASGWYTGATLPVTVKAGDQGLGVRYLVLKDGSTVHRYALPGTGASCTTQDPNATLYGGDTYTVKVPCPTASVSYTVNIDMTTIGDGVHTLQLGVADASGRIGYDAAYTANVNAPGLNPSSSGGSGLPDPGATGPGGCVYEDDGTTCVVPIANTSLPTITGTAKVGQTLTAGNGTWTGAAGAMYTYEWQRKDAFGIWNAIPGATSSSYTLGDADETYQVRVKVTATVGGASQSALSDPSGAVAPAGAGSGGNGGGGGGGGGAGKDADDTPGKPSDDSGPRGDGPSSPGPAAPNSDPNGTPATRDATVSAMFAGNRQRAVAAKYNAGLRVRGTLRSAKGTPIANATVVFWARNNTPGSKSVRLTTATTDTKGRYEATVPRGPSRKITVSYTAFSGDVDPADTASLSVKVKAAAKLVTNVRTVRVGHTLILRGRLAHRTQGGVMVLIGAMDGGQWRSFAHVRTDRKGRFHYTYKFKPGSEGRTFYFSVLVDDRVYPFAAGFSNDVRVRVVR